ncbi:MAG: hypothetical protein ACK5X3_16965 [Pseudomonadota bacterium]|jgi:hypothetical protein
MAEKHELSDEQCDRLVALTMDKLAAKNGIHALDLDDSLTNHHSLRRSIVRAAFELGKTAGASSGGKP